MLIMDSFSGQLTEKVKNGLDNSWYEVLEENRFVSYFILPHYLWGLLACLINSVHEWPEYNNITYTG